MTVSPNVRIDRMARSSGDCGSVAKLLGGTQVTFDAEQARGTAFGKDNVVAETWS